VSSHDYRRCRRLCQVKRGRIRPCKNDTAANSFSAPALATAAIVVVATVVVVVLVVIIVVGVAWLLQRCERRRRQRPLQRAEVATKGRRHANERHRLPVRLLFVLDLKRVAANESSDQSVGVILQKRC
jgi:hypothetical protein